MPSLSAETDDEYNQLFKQNIENEEVIVTWLKTCFGSTCLVWMSKTLPTDLNLPVIGKPPFDILQCFVIAENHPPVLLSLYNSGDDHKKLRPYAVEICRMLQWSLLDFCHLDILVIPCFLQMDQLNKEKLLEELNREMCDAERFFPDSICLEGDSYLSLKEATFAMVRSTFVPSLLEKRSQVHLELMDPGLAHLTSRITEILHSQRTFSVADYIANHRVEHVVANAIKTRFPGRLMKNMLRANESMEEAKAQSSSIDGELAVRATFVASRVTRTKKRQEHMKKTILEESHEFVLDPTYTFRLIVAAIEAGKRVSISKSVSLDCATEDTTHCLRELKRLWLKHNNRDLELNTTDRKTAIYHVDLQDRTRPTGTIASADVLHSTYTESTEKTSVSQSKKTSASESQSTEKISDSSMMDKKRKHPGGSRAQPKSKSANIAGTTRGKMETPPEHHPRESQRLMKVNERARQQHLQRVKAALKDLQDDFSQITRQAKKDKIKNDIFRQWCIKHAEALFPDIGRVAYSVPPFYFNKYAVTLSKKTGFFKRTQKDDSDVRGDWAQRLVGRNFRLLNNALEREGKEDTMFTIGNCLCENMFKWLETGIPSLKTDEENAEKAEWETFKGSIPDVLCPRRKYSRYFQRPEDAKVYRHKTNLIILHKSKGVIFVQVKAVGTLDSIESMYQCRSEKDKKKAVENQKKKIEKQLKQLQNDDKVFCEVMTVDTAVKNERCHFVLALPNFTTREEILEYAIQDEPERKNLDEVTLLLRGDLFTDDIGKAEGDYDLKNFKAWWNKLEDKPVQPDFIKDVIARYIGEFSTPREYSDTSERSLVRNLCDAIRLTGKLVKRLVISKDHEEKVDFAVKRAHVKGPPGSGHTTMLIKKAEHFLKDDIRNNVVVIDMYRGAKGTPIGHEIFISIADVDPTRIHHTAFDVNEKGADKKLLGLTLPKQKEHILFVIDEVLPKKYWEDAVELLASRFADSQVWCADGIVTEDQDTCLLGCTSVELNHILRIPPSVQCVLYHADWDVKRKALYKADTDHQLEVPTNGPSPVSVRHQGHTNAHLKTTECEQCADELAYLLKDKMKLVEGDSSSGGASAAPSVSLPCSIAILYSIPAEHYSELGEGKTNQVETTVDKFNAYQRYIEDCPFVKQLHSRGLPVHNVLLGDMDLQKEDLWDDILVSWVDIFQGLERDVVVFLPGDAASSAKTEPTPRTGSQYELRSKSAAEAPSVSTAASTPLPEGPATRAKLKAAICEGDQQPGPSGSTPAPVSETGGASSVGKGESSITARKIHVPGLANTAEKATSVWSKADTDPRKKAASSSEARCDLRMAEYYWSVEHVQRYSDWDKTNLVFAATRCTAQLILLVP